ncbi:protein TUNAR isoform 1-T1 [Fundulus diaphanus]
MFTHRPGRGWGAVCFISILRQCQKHLCLSDSVSIWSCLTCSGLFKWQKVSPSDDPIWGFWPPSCAEEVSRFVFQIGPRQKLKTFAGKMVNTVCRDEEKGIQDKESKEESILAMLGIIGTILNLVVIIFVYIYTTL